MSNLSNVHLQASKDTINQVNDQNATTLHDLLTEKKEIISTLKQLEQEDLMLEEQYYETLKRIKEQIEIQ